MKSKTWKPFMRMLSLVLVISFCICQIPVGAVSISATDAAEAEKPTAEATIVAEDISKREESVKHFRMSDGTYQAVQYTSPVHFKQDDEWVEYDNTLTETATEETGNPDFVNATSDLSVRLSKKSNGQKWVRLEKDGYKLSWYFLDANKVTGQVKTAENDDDLLTLETVTSTVTYPDFFDGVDLVERVRPNGVKEDIILKRAGTRTTFDIEYRIDKLTAEQVDDRTIALKADDGTVVYTLYAPYMQDADGAVSTALTYQIVSTKNKKLTVRLTADTDWLSANNRVFPVTIDPGLTTGQGLAENNPVQATYVASGTPNDTYNNGEMIKVGQTSDIGAARTYLKLTSLPDIGRGGVVVDARLRMYSCSGENTPVATVHLVTGEWSPSTLTWNNQPTFQSSAEAARQTFYDVSAQMYMLLHEWTVTRAVQQWYLQGNCTGLMFKSLTESNATIGFAGMHLADYAEDIYQPALILSYRDGTGLENYWSYTGVAAGRGGSAQVNLFNGNMVVTQSATQTADGNLLPISISLTYNSVDFDQPAPYSKLGNGWRTNFHQTITETGGDDYLHYTDGDGTKHAFYVPTDTRQALTTDISVSDEDGLGYTLHIASAAEQGSTAIRYTIVDKSDTKLHFNGRGQLMSIEDINENKIELEYEAMTGSYSYLKTIKDGAEREYHFQFNINSNGDKVMGVIDPSKRITTFQYTGELLTGITFADGKQVSYSYDNTGRLNSVVGNDGGTVEITYQPSTTQPRAESLTRSYGQTPSEEYTFEYVVGETTVVDIQDRRTAYQFDALGQTTGVVSDAMGAGRFFEYADRNVSPLVANKLTVESAVQSSVDNLLRNPRVDTNTGYTLFKSGTLDSAYTASWDGSRGHTGNGSLKISRTLTETSNASQSLCYGQTVVLPETGYYTFSAFVNTNGATLSPGAVIRVERFTADGATHLGGRQAWVTHTGVDEWKRVQITEHFEAGELASIRCGANEPTFEGTVWFDDLQLEFCETANHFNLLENNTFQNGTTAWTNESNGEVYVITEPTTPKPNGYAMRVVGAFNEARRITQTATVTDGRKGDVYALGSWGKAHSLPISGTDEFSTYFGLKLEFLDGDTVKQTETIPFNAMTSGWQFIGGQAVAKQAYTSVRMVLDYNRNLNAAYFAQPYLYRERFGVSYTYDKNGNIIATEDLAALESSFAYGEKEAADLLARMLNPTGSAYLYSYTNPTKMLAAVSTDGIRYTPTYDVHGNVTSAVTQPMKRVSTLQDSMYYHLFNASTATLLKSDDGIIWPSALQYLPNNNTSARWMIQLNNDETVTFHCGNRMLYGNKDATDVLYKTILVTDWDAKKEYIDYENRFFVSSPTDDGTVVITLKGTNYVLTIADDPGDGSRYITLTPLIGEPKLNQKWYLYEPADTGTEFIKSTATYTENGNLLSSMTDALGHTANYNYDTVKGLLNTLTDAIGSSTNYTYDANNDRLKTVTAGGQQVSYTYDNRDRLTTVTLKSGEQYFFEYTLDNQVEYIYVRNSTSPSDMYGLAMRIYDNYGRMTMQRYGTGNAVAYTYDALDRVTAIAYNDSETPAVEYAYDKSGQLCAVIDHCAGTTTRYVYDLSGRVTEETEYTRAALNATGIRHQTTYSYDAKTGQLTAVTRDGVTERYAYGNIRDDKSPETVYAVSRNNQTQWQYTYDALGRRVTSTLAPLGKTTTYTYQNGGHGVNSTSTQLATETTDGVTTAYTYDAAGNIVGICTGGTSYESYQYDALGQLTHHADANGDVYLYTYGDNGNLSEVRKNGEIIKTYGYGNTVWKDQLTSFNGNAITYDNIGNPLTYHNGASMSWDRRQLLSYTHDGTTVAFTYDSVGNRLTKTVGNTVTNYVYVGGRLEKQTTGNNTLAFLYDEIGAIYGFTYNGTAYYYERNIQGDVLGIYDSTGTKLVTYTYDAWGALLDMTDTSLNGIGTINPIRYRGYYYDTEMQTYWLSTRFYDPEICRFINADGYVSTGQDVTGYNMFAYCGNNPVDRADSTGMFWKKAGAFLEKLAEAAVHAFHIEIGFGIGFGGSTTIGGVKVSACAYQDGFTVGYKKGEMFTSIKGEMGISVGADESTELALSTEYEHLFEFGSTKYRDEHGTTSSPWDVYNCPETVKDPYIFSAPILNSIRSASAESDGFVGFSAQKHCVFGAHFAVGWDVNAFLEFMTE